MKKSLKTFLSIFMCAILSVFMLPSVFAHLDSAHIVQLNQLASQYSHKTAPADLSEWREKAIAQINAIASSNFRDHALAAKAFSYLMSRILNGSGDLGNSEIHSFGIHRAYDELGNIISLKCRVTTVDSHMFFWEM